MSLTNLVRIMNDGQSNHGFLWILQIEQKYRSVFAASSDYSDPAKRPKLVVTYQPMKKYFYLKDHLGNIRVTIDENGDVKGYNEYGESHHFRGYPFGLRMSERSVDPDLSGPGRSMNTALNYALYKFSSKELDEESGINWYYFGARYYDPVIGRWLSVDPLSTTSPSLTPYHYVRNNPLFFLDPDGIKEIKASNYARNNLIGLKYASGITGYPDSDWQISNPNQLVCNEFVAIAYREAGHLDFPVRMDKQVEWFKKKWLVLYRDKFRRSW